MCQMVTRGHKSKNSSYNVWIDDQQETYPMNIPPWNSVIQPYWMSN